MRKLVALLASVYLLALVAQGVLGLADGALRLLAHSAALGLPQGLLGLAVFLCAILLYAVMGLFGVLPARIFAVPVVFPFVAFLMVTPLSLELASRLTIADMVRFDPTVVAAKAPGLLVLAVAASLVQIAVGAWAFRSVRRSQGGRDWVLPPGALGGARFSFKRAGVFALANLVLFAVGLPLYLFGTLIVGVNALGRGYVLCDRREISVVTRDYARDGKLISLVGMMHIAEKGSYRRLVDGIDPKGAVLLEEGVSDRTHRITQRSHYAPAAKALGLETQADAFHPEEIREKGLEVESGDVDTEIFSQDTVDLLNAIFKVHEGQKLDLEAVVRIEMKLSDPEVVETLFHDILDRRNEHLLAAIDGALEGHERVIVPWGAYHLPDVGAALEAKGWKVVRTEVRPVVEFSTVWNRIVRRESGKVDPGGM